MLLIARMLWLPGTDLASNGPDILDGPSLQLME